MGEAALSIQNLWKHYQNNPVVKGIHLDIRPGEIFGLLGPNGAGKSTTINLVSGVARMERGSVRVFGRDNQKDFRETRRMIGVMHQDLIIDPFFPIGRALKIHSGYYGVRDDRQWREHLIERLALGPHTEKHINKLSGGMKRRFMVAKAMIHKPRLLILDEPTAGVDVELRRAMWEFVREMNAGGTTILLTTHYLEEAEQMCGRVAIMNHGEMVAVEETEKLIHKVDQQKVVVTLQEPLAEIPEGLTRFKPDLKSGGNLIEFSVGVSEGTGAIIEALYQSGVGIASLTSQQPSLEEVFLKMTGGESPQSTQLEGALHA